MNQFLTGIAISALAVGFAQAETINKLDYNLVNLSGTVKKTVERDQMTAVVYITEEGRTPAELTKKVTEKTNEVVRLVRAQKQLNLTQDARRSSRIAKKTFGDLWEERATLTIEGKDFSAINTILGQIGDIARIDRIYYSVSKDAREKLEDDLLTDGLKKITGQASLIMNSMKKPKFRLVTMNVNNGMNYIPRREMVSAKMGMDMPQMAPSAPEAAAGNEEVSLSINAQVQLYGSNEPVSNQLNYNLISFNESAREAVDRDEMKLSLAVMEEGTNPVELTKKVTEKSNQIIRMAKANKQLTVSQTSRTSQKIERKTFSGDLWAETSILTIEGKDFSAINQILSQIDKSVRIEGITFSVSTQAKEAKEGELTRAALVRLNKKSELIAKTLGLNDFNLVDMSLSYNGDDSPIPYYGFAGGKADADEKISAYVPEAAAGQTDLTVNINAQVQLRAGTK